MDKKSFNINCRTTSDEEVITTDESITDIDSTSIEDEHGSIEENMNKDNLKILQSYNLEQNEYNFPKRKPVDVEFEDIKYTVGKFSFAKTKYERKEILHGINGAFRSGQLTAIMGPSGAGKSSLINILAGYVQSGFTGTITVNGKHRSMNSKSFKHISTYIQQNDALRSYITVLEAMTIATHLKLGYTVTKEYKNDLITRILLLLGLDKRINTFTGRLSGGQKKRLAIALEMISNPPVIFLDEPTTGLDSMSCTRCISLLKRLAQDGRTIICTIHQPSALIFEMFDKLYALSDGNCIYQGPIKELIPFMYEQGLPCPSYHNPADFLMEIAIGEYGNDLESLVNAALKKYYEDNDKYRLKIKGKIITDNCDMELISSIINSQNPQNAIEMQCAQNSSDDYKENNMISIKSIKNTQPASLIMQFVLLFERNFKSNIRNTFLILSRLIAHVTIAFLFGYLYRNVGQTATTIFANYVYLYGTILLIVYTGKMAVVLSFPLEMEILSREHFNRWYNLAPYYLSVISFEIPFQMVCASIYVVISYYLTGNYNEYHRFLYFILMCLMTTICAQSWGYFVGTTMPVKIAVFIGPILAVLFSVFGFCTRYQDLTKLFSWMWHISYFRSGFHGIIDTVFGMDRPDYPCPETTFYCHFKNPKLFLSLVSINHNDMDMKHNIILMSCIIVTMHILTIFTLWFKLNKR